MKRLLRKIVNVPVVNSFLRIIVKFFAVKTRFFFDSLIRYVHVSGTIRIAIENNYFSLWANGDDALASKLYYDNEWETNVTSWFCKFCATQNFIIDAGANIGLFSLLAAKQNPNAVVHAFEPNPYNKIRLKKNIALNGLEGRIHVHESALGNTNDPVTFFLPADNRISDVSSVYHNHTTFFNDFRHHEIQVPCTTLDYFCVKNAFAPQVIKIDVELYELQVILGMKSLLTSTRPFLFCEIFNDEVKRKLNLGLDAELEKGYTIRLQEFLESAGYYFYLIVPAGILWVDSLRLSPVSSMYLLLPMKLKQSFYLCAEADMVLNELDCG